jgi:hypothetical protein
MVKPLLRWQEFMRFNDEQAASALALELREYRRQLATRPSAQTARLCVLLVLYGPPDIAAITAAAANLDRLPARPEDPAIAACSDWS